jgi:hypothetical protein
VRGVLVDMFREARDRLGDPVEAWASIVEDPDKARAYKSRRGKGGFVRSSWDEVTDLIAAAHVHTIRSYGPDRIVGFSPIPAISMVSYQLVRGQGRLDQREQHGFLVPDVLLETLATSSRRGESRIERGRIP